MSEIEISAVDWAVLVGYLVIIAAVGMIAARKTRTSGHYFLACRGGVQRRRIRHLVPVEEPIRDTVLLADRPPLSPIPAHHDGGGHGRPLRSVDGGHLHSVRPGVFHHQHGNHAEGRGEGDRASRRWYGSGEQHRS